METARWTGLTWDPMQSAVAALLRHNPELPAHRQPVSWRLPASAAPVVAEAFYPFAGFQAGTTARQRSLSLTTAGSGGPLDAAVERAASTGWALYELPARHTLRTDAEAARACAELALRVLQRGAVAVSERTPAGAQVTADRIAIGATHRDQVAAIRGQLGMAGAGSTADTASQPVRAGPPGKTSHPGQLTGGPTRSSVRNGRTGSEQPGPAGSISHPVRPPGRKVRECRG